MDVLNALLTQLGTLLLAPFRNHPALGLVFWSSVTGVVMAYVFGKTSNQGALRNAADNIRAQLLAVKLFKDDLYVTFQCQMRLLKSTGARLLHSVPPMLVMIIPLLFVLTQLAMRYEFQSLMANEQTVVTMHIKPESWKELRETKLEAADGFAVETEALRDEKTSTLYWRIRAADAPSRQLTWSIGDQKVVKQLPIADRATTMQVASPRRAGDSFWDRVLYPAEPSFSAASPIDSIDIALAPRETPILGLNLPWWATFFLVSMLVAFITGKLIGVQY